MANATTRRGIQDVSSAKALDAIDFTSRFCRPYLHISGQQLQALINPDDLKQQTRTTQGGGKSASGFQAFVEQYYRKLKERLLNELEGFDKFDCTKDGLICIPQSFSMQLKKHNLIMLISKYGYRGEKT